MGEIFRLERPKKAMVFTGERFTSAESGQIEIEHLHRYFLARYFCRGKDVLDVASGEGYGSALLSQVASSVIGVDVADEAVEHATRNYVREGLSFRKGDGRQLPVADASVDVVVSFETIEHLYEHERFLAEIRRVLRPGGLLVLSSPERDIYSPPDHGCNPHHIHELTRREFYALVRKHFPVARFFGQRAMLGSAIVPDEPLPRADLPVVFEQRGPNQVESSHGLGRATYLICIASEVEVGPLPESLFVFSGNIDRVFREIRELHSAVRLEQDAAARHREEIQTLIERSEQERAAARERSEQERAAAYACFRDQERKLLNCHQELDSHQKLASQNLASLNRAMSLQREQHDSQLAAVHAEIATIRAADRADVAAAHAQLAAAQAQMLALNRGYSAQLRRVRRQNILQFVRGLPRERSRIRRIVAALRSSPLFDPAWYLAHNEDVREPGIDPFQHYARFGADEGRDPGPQFSTTYYVLTYPDVVASDYNPLEHYELFGRAEGRHTRPPSEPEISPTADAETTLEPTADAETTAEPTAKVETTAEPTTAAVRPKVAERPATRLVYISGEPDTPGHVYRTQRPAATAAQLGADVVSMTVTEITSRLAEIEEATVVVIWRTSWCGEVAAAIAAARRGGAVVVFDVDDLMIVPELASLDIIDGIRSQNFSENGVREHYAAVRQTMLAADVCFATTEELAFHMRGAGKPVHVLPNGFDQTTHDLSRVGKREWRSVKGDGLIRIGYASGSRTHQRDLGLAIEAIARLLRENALCRLVLFRSQSDNQPLIDVAEYSALAGLHDRIEWRPLQPLAELPLELARFDINLAPLELGNPFCEAKSELKFWEAALVEVPTVASPTGPFRRAIKHGKTGFLASTADEWYIYLKQLADDPLLRSDIGRAAYHASLATFGPTQRAAQLGRVIEQLQGGAEGARAFALGAHLSMRQCRIPKVYPSDIVLEQDRHGDAQVTVIIPLYNYQNFVLDALESVREQTLDPLDLVIVDGCSTDNSLAVAKEWVESNADRFNRVLLLKNRTNYGLGFCRNSGFDAADTPYVLPLDADNKLLPNCCEALLRTILAKRSAYVYPSIQHFGGSTAVISNLPYDPQRLVPGNYIDALALVSKEAWAIVGGYDHVRYGWEDYDFWCRIAEQGFRGEWHPEVLAQYRVHQSSMMTVQTTVPDNYKNLFADFRKRHAWVWLGEQHTARQTLKPRRNLTPASARSRIDALVPILRCPETKQKLALDESRTALVSVDGLRSWPILEGRPMLSWPLRDPRIKPINRTGDQMPDSALDLIRATRGLVLSLDAGGSCEKLDHVVEVDHAISDHTDVVADASELPFDDETFDAAVVIGAFEHYREPHKVSAELRRILKPGGRIFIRAAFLQPLHEPPRHFFNCTRYGLAEWFRKFETTKLHVPENFAPDRSIAWLASECEAALRRDVSAASADAFMAEPIGELIHMWRDASRRASSPWTDFHKLTQMRQDTIAAGFEFLGRKPLDLPDLDGSGGSHVAEQ